MVLLRERSESVGVVEEAPVRLLAMKDIVEVACSQSVVVTRSAHIAGVHADRDQCARIVVQCMTGCEVGLADIAEPYHAHAARKPVQML